MPEDRKSGGKTRGKDEKKGGMLGDDRYVCYLDCSDDFTAVDRCQNSSNCKL